MINLRRMAGAIRGSLVPVAVVLAIVTLAAGWLPLPGSSASAGAQQPLDAAAILKAIVDNERGGAVHAIVSLVVSRPDGETRYEMEMASDGADQALMRVTSPAREAGQAFLRSGDNLWVYAPRLKRALRLPPSGRSDRFLGSDVSYADMSGRDSERDFVPRILEQDASGVALELLPRPGAPTPYGRVVLRAAMPGYVPIEALFYDQRGQAVRRVTMGEFTPVGSRSVPTQITVEDLLRPGHTTTLAYRSYRFGVSIPDDCFKLQALERGCSLARP